MSLLLSAESSDGSRLILEQTLSASAETEQERMIRFGEMTPFGTVVSSTNALVPEAHVEKPAPTLKCDVSLFDDYLCNEQQKSMARIKSKTTKLKSSNRERNTSSSSDKQLVTPVDSKNGKQKKFKHPNGDHHEGSNTDIFLHDGKSRHPKHQDDKRLHVSGKQSCTDPGSKHFNLKAKKSKLKHNLSQDGSIEKVDGDNTDEAFSYKTDEEYIPDEEVDGEEDDLNLGNYASNRWFVEGIDNI